MEIRGGRKWFSFFLRGGFQLAVKGEEEINLKIIESWSALGLNTLTPLFNNYMRLLGEIIQFVVRQYANDTSLYP